MAKNKPRWETLSAYELMKKKLLGEATPEEVEAVAQMRAIWLAGGRPRISNADGRLVVR